MHVCVHGRQKKQEMSRLCVLSSFSLTFDPREKDGGECVFGGFPLHSGQSGAAITPHSRIQPVCTVCVEVSLPLQAPARQLVTPPPPPAGRPQGCVLVTLNFSSSFLLLPPSRNTRFGVALRGPLNTVTRHLWSANTHVQSLFSFFFKHTLAGPRLLCPGWRGVNWRRVTLTSVAQSSGRK